MTLTAPSESSMVERPRKTACGDSNTVGRRMGVCAAESQSLREEFTLTTQPIPLALTKLLGARGNFCNYRVLFSKHGLAKISGTPTKIGQNHHFSTQRPRFTLGEGLVKFFMSLDHN